MATSFSALKKSRETAMDRLTKEINKFSSNNSKQTDERFWQPAVDKAGNGYAIIRFLPAVDGEDVPWVRIWSHGFQGTGGWYIENSLTTIGKQDPVSELNSKLWNSGIEKDKEVARKQKRRLTYISNILIVKDPANPANEGKVFLYKFGKKIFDKLNEKMNPQFEDEKPINPFDFWTGANFKVKIRQVEGYRNYDKSEFDEPTALFDGDDEKLETLWKSQHKLQAFLSPDQFKSYEELKARLDRVLNTEAPARRRDNDEDEEREETVSKRPVAEAKVGKTKEEPAASKKETAPWDDEEEGDDLKFFEKLAKD